ncbi:MAG: 3-methyladenine DNA glycosylase [Gemmataceae bacterium]
MLIQEAAIWRPTRSGVVAELEPFAAACEHRRSHRIVHPIDDFLFDYYSLRPSQLRRWSPGPGVLLLDASPEELDHGRMFIFIDGVLRLPPYPERRRTFLNWLIRYLEAVASRPMALGCFGMHEWAMVYRTNDVRHSATPLRLSSEEIAAVVESSELRCTHFDAFRFFTPAAAPRNRIALSRAATTEHDQPGCVHVTMDLVRYAMKLAPWCPTRLFADCFHLARAARIVDMRASPYDLTAYGLEPIHIETRDGRDEYAAAQRELAAKAEPLRQRLLSLLRELASPSALACSTDARPCLTDSAANLG